MPTDHQQAWVKEFLLGLAQTEDDKKSVWEIVDTFTALWKVQILAKRLVNRPPAVFASDSPKAKLQEALKPFLKERAPRESFS